MTHSNSISNIQNLLLRSSEALHLVYSQEPVNTFSNVFTIHNNPVAKTHKYIMGVPLSFPKITEGLVSQTVRKRAGTKKERRKKRGHCKFWLSRNISFFSKRRAVAALIFGLLSKTMDYMEAGGITAVLLHTLQQTAVGDHMRSPAYDRGPL